MSVFAPYILHTRSKLWGRGLLHKFSLHVSFMLHFRWLIFLRTCYESFYLKSKFTMKLQAQNQWHNLRTILSCCWHKNHCLCPAISMSINTVFISMNNTTKKSFKITNIGSNKSNVCVYNSVYTRTSYNQIERTCSVNKLLNFFSVHFDNLRLTVSVTAHDASYDENILLRFLTREIKILLDQSTHIRVGYQHFLIIPYLARDTWWYFIINN